MSLVEAVSRKTRTRHGIGPGRVVHYKPLLDGALVRTHIDVRGRVALRAPGSVELVVGRSAHRMAEHLRRMGDVLRIPVPELGEPETRRPCSRRRRSGTRGSTG